MAGAPSVTIFLTKKHNQSAAGILDFFFVSLLLSIFFLYLAKSFSFLPISVLIAFTAGICVTFWIARSSFLQDLIRFSSVTALIFPIVFLSHKNIYPLVKLESHQVKSVDTNFQSPVVIILFDQLATAALINDAGSIDQLRYPSFYELSRSAYWFKNATTNAQSTVVSVPSLLTGKYPVGKKAPNGQEYPNNLFGLLRGSVHMNVHEHATNLSPPNVEDDSNYSGFLTDLGLIYLHIVLPDNLSNDLPSIEDRPANFLQPADGEDEPQSTVGNVTKFLSGLRKKPIGLHYLHIDVPHTPYRFLPSGKQYTWEGTIPALESSWGFWGKDELPVLKAQQRYLAQVQYSDRILGSVIEVLKETGSWEDALLLVTSDHGASFLPAGHTRAVVGSNVGDIAYIPMLLKLPQQEKPYVSYRNVESIDVLPTLLSAIGANVPEFVDGSSVFDSGQNRGNKKIWSTRKGINALHEFSASEGGDFRKLHPMSRNFVWDSGNRWNGLAAEEHDFVGLPFSEVAEYFYELQGEHGFKFDGELTKLEAVNELHAGWVRGEVIMPSVVSSSREQLTIAVVINSEIVAMTSTFSNHSSTHYFTELLPEGAFMAKDLAGAKIYVKFP